MKKCTQDAQPELPTIEVTGMPSPQMQRNIDAVNRSETDFAQFDEMNPIK